MAFQGKILFIIALAFFITKVRCDDDHDHTEGAHMFLTRGLNSDEEAADLLESDDEGDTEIAPTPASTSSHQPGRETIYEDLHSPQMMQLLTEEYVKLIETEIASKTLEKVMEKIKVILKNKKSVGNFREIGREVYKYMTNPNMPKMITNALENRYKYYIDEKTPDLIKKKFIMIKSIANNSNIQDHIQFFRKDAVKFLTAPGDVRKRIADGFSLLSAVLRLPSINWS